MYEKMKLKITMGKIFIDHAIWTRMFIVDLLNNSPSIDYTIARLLKNQDAVGNCMKIYFGDVAGDNLISLLKEHVTISSDLLRAIKDEDTIRTTTLEEQLIINIENISIFFGAINPCYSIEELIDMLNTHLILVKYQFIARMDGDYNADIMYHDMGLHQILMLSDYIAQGIIERFFKEDIYLFQGQTEEQMITEEHVLDQSQIDQDQSQIDQDQSQIDQDQSQIDQDQSQIDQ